MKRDDVGRRKKIARTLTHCETCWATWDAVRAPVCVCAAECGKWKSNIDESIVVFSFTNWKRIVLSVVYALMRSLANNLLHNCYSNILVFFAFITRSLHRGKFVEYRYIQLSITIDTLVRSLSPSAGIHLFTWMANVRATRVVTWAAGSNKRYLTHREHSLWFHIDIILVRERSHSLLATRCSMRSPRLCARILITFEFIRRVYVFITLLSIHHPSAGF